jgi:predicted dehydrogenase
MNKPLRKPADARSRRDFIKTSSLLVAGGAVPGGLNVARAAHAFGSDTIRIGLVGCGVRGVSAAIQALTTTAGADSPPRDSVRLVAMADVFGDNLQQAYRSLKGKHGALVDVPRQRRFTGLEACQEVLNCDIDVVLLTTPPGWRPLHFEAAMRAGKHVFMESPVAVDAAGIQRVLAANELAKQQGLTVAVGSKRRYEPRYRETILRLRDGAIGDITYARVYWNGSGAWVRSRQPGQSELEYQLRNWYYFNWLSGDHIVEQHIHNLDVINWLLDAHPVQCNGMGGRQVRTGGAHGEIYDHHFCEFAYPGTVRMFSQCRHMRGCWNNVSEHVHGTRGRADISGAKIYDARDELIWRGRGGGEGQQTQQDELFTSLRRGRVLNELDRAAQSTFTAILGRMATYSGRLLQWEDAINSGESLADLDALTSLQAAAPVQPREPGSQAIEERYAIAVPGQPRAV